MTWSDLTDCWGSGMRPDRRPQPWAFGLVRYRLSGYEQTPVARLCRTGRFAGGECWGFCVRVGGVLAEGHDEDSHGGDPLYVLL